MRLFIAIHPDPALLRRLERAQQILAFSSGGGRFPQPGDLHVTLAFLGELPEDQVLEILEAMESAAESVAETGLPELAIAGVGAMPGSRGELWIADVLEDPALTGLARRLGQELRRRGYAFENRRFRPHITLGRGLKPLPEPAGVCRRMEAVLEGSPAFARGFSLFQSTLRPSGPVYEELAYVAFPEGRA